MNRLFGNVLFGLLFVSIYAVSLFPMRVLYALSSITSLMILYLFSYRKQTVVQNLSRSFPDKNYREIDHIMKGFYLSFTDNVAEILKSLSISHSNQMDKLTVSGMELIKEQLSEGKNVIVCMGHCGNWEILNTLPIHIDTHMYAIYKPLRNKSVDRLFIKLRGRFGMGLVPARSIVRHILTHTHQPSVYFFIADQCPKLIEEQYKVHFLNQQTSMFSGTEKLAHSTNAAVMYMHVTRSERGKYQATCKPICLNPKETAPVEIIQRYSELLEQNILESPSDWLWTHKRWKR
ncbi:KDO2-lipid IV(A) lauroyltransferase [Parabacteroides sp. PF5-5]|uniref:lysophospholipid acyltransferase family protein n=1 Tax=unclassified Parabacteroides TaxID=2649774 RepID=UPI00247464AF|nr:MULTISPECIES: lysophospholipid acyltransferase family protein [unclassified Parabacteroides]MDH6303956.1 KDO2-lipid IV(A) lauroyltransferase [Parabacteroides sp. PH5-39]MDH6314572.1 KDO2-lipid IV(A) lauroyltransferase [Parabacteroides sp. PF5-13]MDH6318363.1 KDO2-lipid IV(A) lauroyltransferase [Parabacteroides sp. PH5-13]MDH6322345.1 KDO2-lipid IV(A) lauroyltransferase [Parabacteroides sp. PH5-8]MDH6325576.1 KDO2-lipid IV(A) lauroyltransferase [Parabacteroides sp. PH5-41]